MTNRRRCFYSFILKLYELVLVRVTVNCSPELCFFLKEVLNSNFFVCSLGNYSYNKVLIAIITIQFDRLDLVDISEIVLIIIVQFILLQRKPAPIYIFTMSQLPIYCFTSRNQSKNTTLSIDIPRPAPDRTRIHLFFQPIKQTFYKLPYQTVRNIRQYEPVRCIYSSIYYQTYNTN